MLPTKHLKAQYRNEWLPIMQKMQNSPGVVIPNSVEAVSDSFISSSYEIASKYLKENICGFIWKKKHETWTVGTWSHKTLPNQIQKYGSEKEKSNLPPRTHRNQPHSQKRTLKRTESARKRKVRHTRANAAPTGRVSLTVNNSTRAPDSFNHAFSIQVVPTETSQTRKETIPGSLELTNCSFCNGGIKTNHCCKEPVKGLRVFVEGEEEEICGKAMCIECRSQWGDQELFINRCKFHRRS